MCIPILVRELGTGSTVDISSIGVSFVIPEPMELGRVIRFRIAAEQPEGQFALDCDGTVVRVESRAGVTFAAATIEQLAVGRRSEGH